MNEEATAPAGATAAQLGMLQALATSSAVMLRSFVDMVRQSVSKMATPCSDTEIEKLGQVLKVDGRAHVACAVSEGVLSNAWLQLGLALVWCAPTCMLTLAWVLRALHRGSAQGDAASFWLALVQQPSSESAALQEGAARLKRAVRTTWPRVCAGWQPSDAVNTCWRGMVWAVLLVGPSSSAGTALTLACGAAAGSLLHMAVWSSACASLGVPQGS